MEQDEEWEQELPESRSLLDTESLMPIDQSEPEAAVSGSSGAITGPGPATSASGRALMTHVAPSRVRANPGPAHFGTRRDNVVTGQVLGEPRRDFASTGLSHGEQRRDIVGVGPVGPAREISHASVGTGLARPGSFRVGTGPQGASTSGGGSHHLNRSDLLCLKPDLSESIGKKKASFYSGQ